MLESQKTLAAINDLCVKGEEIGRQIVAAESFSRMFDLLLKMKDNPQLFEEFKKSPESVVVREVGRFFPNQTHFHTADDKNNYIPPEGSAVDQLMKGYSNPDVPWIRVEVRVGFAGYCLFNCGVCT
jgi:hypothetical protein